MIIRVAVQRPAISSDMLRGEVVWPDTPIATRELAVEVLDMWQDKQAHRLPFGGSFERSESCIMSLDGTRVVELSRTLTIVEAGPAISA